MLDAHILVYVDAPRKRSYNPIIMLIHLRGEVAIAQMEGNKSFYMKWTDKHFTEHWPVEKSGEEDGSGESVLESTYVSVTIKVPTRVWTV